MNCIALIAELTDICIRQAKVIKTQAYILEQLGVEISEEEALQGMSRLRELIGEWSDDAI